MFKAYISSIVVLLFMLLSCQQGNKNKEGGQSYTSGVTTIIADESFSPIVDDELFIFKSAYPRTNVHIIYKPEKELLNEFLNQKVRIAILSRLLDSQEAKVYENRNIKIRSTRFAIDAIALVAHKSQTDTAISVQEIIDAMHGKPARIKRLVFDNANSSTVRYLMDLADVKVLPQTGVYALQSNPEVIKYVHEHPGAIGVIGVNWMNEPGHDLDGYIKDLKELSIKNLPGKPGSDNYYKPDQSNLALGVYPLTRNLYIINCEGGPGPGSGFAAFLAGERGQRIVLKSGLLPDSIPPREILIRK